MQAAWELFDNFDPPERPVRNSLGTNRCDSTFIRVGIMSRTTIFRLVCTIFLTLLVYPAAPQEPARKGADRGS
jgi:hypothetical protein